MLGSRTNSVHQARLQARTIRWRLLRADLHAGRRWHWCGKRGWWLHCSLLNEQDVTRRLRRFVATVSEASAFLHVQQDDWEWQEVAPKPVSDDTSSQQQAYVPFLMF